LSFEEVSELFIFNSVVLLEKAFPSFFNISYGSTSYFLCLETKKVKDEPKERAASSNALLLNLIWCKPYGK